MPRKASRVQPKDEVATVGSAVAANLRKVIDLEQRAKPGEGSVNLWATSHKLKQPTVRRILIGKQSPTEKMIEALAKAAKCEPWHLLVPSFDPADKPVLVQDNPGMRKLLQNIASTKEALEGVLRREGSSDFVFSLSLVGNVLTLSRIRLGSLHRIHNRGCLNGAANEQVFGPFDRAFFGEPLRAGDPDHALRCDGSWAGRRQSPHAQGVAQSMEPPGLQRRGP